MFTETQGDLFEYVGNSLGKVLYIPHIVNNKNAWGAGFVVPLGRLYPEAKKRYHEETYLQMLGKTQLIPCSNHMDTNHSYRMVVVANMCAQTLGGGRPLFYNHLVRCMESVAVSISTDMANDSRATYEIVCPRFGSALAGGNWDFIKELINDCWVRKGITVRSFYL